MSEATSKKPVSTEYRHIKCEEGAVNAVLRQHGLFYWELMQTQTVVSKESHLEPATFVDEILGNGDTIYSVTTEERFATVNLKRDKGIPNYTAIRSVEAQYFGLVRQLEALGGSVVDSYAVPHQEGASCGGLLLRFLFFPYVWYEEAGCLGVILAGWPAVIKVFQRDGVGRGILFLFLPVTSYYQRHKLAAEKNLAEFLSLKEKMDGLVEDNKELLNV